MLSKSIVVRLDLDIFLNFVGFDASTIFKLEDYAKVDVDMEFLAS